MVLCEPCVPDLDGFGAVGTNDTDGAGDHFLGLAMGTHGPFLRGLM